MFVVVQLHPDARRMTVFGPFGTAHAADLWASTALIAGTYFTKRVTSPPTALLQHEGGPPYATS
jgi:hypothetical protein